MCPTILHIYGPFAINSYGFFIALGVAISLWLAHKDPRSSKLISNEQALALLTGIIIAGIAGARLLYFLIEQTYDNWYELFAFWQGGGTELGSIIAIALFTGYYLYKHRIPALPLLDLAATYAPLVQAFARIGCFCAGCCHGAFTASPCSVIYTHPNSMAPLNTPLHPAQLYASALFFALYFFMRFKGLSWTKPGQQFALYLMGASLIRFVIDFWRGDLVYPESSYRLITYLTSYQWVSLGMFTGAGIVLLMTLFYKPKHDYT